MLPDIVKGDPMRLRQVLINLIGNAVKFSSSGDIIVSTRGNQTASNSWEILFSIEDHGIGISETAKSKLFSPFQQADNSFTRKYGGSGLGLVISKKMVELMGGSLWFESTKGNGSTFFFNLPITSLDNPNKQKVQFMQGKKVLVVESNAILLQAIERYLISIGITVFKSQSREVALQHSKELTLDLVIIGKDHSQLATDIEKTSCVVLCSSYVEFSKQKGIHYVPLPLRYTKLFDCLISIFGKSQLCCLSSSNVTSVKDLSAIRILVAEDNALNQKVVMKVLDSVHCANVEIVADGNQALETVKKKRFDVVLMDCMMPVMNGYESTERIRSEVPLQEQPIIVALTANAFEENKKQCLLAGMDFVLTKPLQKKELVAMLELIANRDTASPSRSVPD
jgi:CheY-like chemotaxis protein